MFVVNNARRRRWRVALPSLIALAAAGCGTARALGGGGSAGTAAARTRRRTAGRHADGRRRSAVHRPRRGARPDLPRLVRRRNQRDQRGRRGARAQVQVQSGRHPRRSGRCGAGGASDVRLDLEPALIIGCTSDEAASVVPIFTANKTVSFCMTGQSEFDHVKFPYFYRLVPPDLSESYAMIWIANSMRHYKRIALAFGNDIGSQTFIQPAIAAIKEAGMTLVANETLDLNATTFRTEAAKIVAAKPDVILTEALGPPEAAFLSEVKQLNGGKLIAGDRHLGDDLARLVQVGRGRGRRERPRATSGPTTWSPRRAGRRSARSPRRSSPRRARSGNTGDFSTYLTAPGAVHLYDGINLAALAMISARARTRRCLQDLHRRRSATGCRARRTCTRSPRGRGAEGGQGDPLHRARRARPASMPTTTRRASSRSTPTARQGRSSVAANIPTAQLRASD